MAVRPRTFRPLRVASVDRLCADAAAVTFEPPVTAADEAGEYDFRAGQSLTLRREVDGREERRSYSLCAPVGGPLRIGVREVPGGLFSSWLINELRVGDVVEALPPLGTFTPDLDRPGHHVLVAAGSGITPVLSIAASVLADPRSQVTLFYGNRRSDTVMFADELADLKDRHTGRFQLVHVLSREPREAELFSGRLDHERFARLVEALVDVEGVDHWWLCGPYGMVEDARAALGAAGVPAGRVHRELFYAEEAEVDGRPPTLHHEEAAFDGPSATATVRLDGRETTVSVPYGTTVLEGAQRVRPDLPFACKGGVCGTCRALVLSGEVRMRRNFALEKEELAAGYVLTCQAEPVSETVRLDYDS
ncbi:ring-1,2-phenylacetyl-CoA epoxidase subunit PaaE [Streptacidiphilus sp. MAP12-16]|uniref:1,2-phenylacetyl-CoA epoxidase subunit PaaE n=1 Tax=Streptacidiphilus sp. MAP12-16 TaxID=3156300 RepID=UPI003512ADB2